MIESLNTFFASIYNTITVQDIVTFTVIYFCIIWIALIVWVMKDISVRTNSILFQLLCIFTILILTPFGLFIYLLIRPGKTVYEKFYDEANIDFELLTEILEERKQKITSTQLKEINKKPIKKLSKKEEAKKDKVKEEKKPKKTQLEVKKFK